MFLYFIALMTAAFVVLLSHMRSEANRWAAFFLAIASLGGLPSQLDNPQWTVAIETVNHLLTPYGVLIFAVVYSELTGIRTKRALKRLMLLPAAITAIVAVFHEPYRISYVLLLAWAAPYYLAACYLLIHSLLKERDLAKRRSRMMVTVICVPTLLAVLVFINIANVVAPDFEFFRYVSLFIIYSLAAALLGVFAYGVLGVKLRFERDSLDGAMKAASMGTRLLNHSIKNEVAKIAVSAENLRHTANGLDEQARRQLDIIAGASDHMLTMVNRMHGQMKDIQLQKRLVRLDLLIDRCMGQHQPLFEQAGVRAEIQLSEPIEIECDPVHLSEAFGNLILNAIEAMPNGGSLTVTLQQTKKICSATFADTGEGVEPSHLPSVFDPFFSTKNRRGNFGLGLSYVYNVMRKSGGTAEMNSVKGQGATVILRFPAGNTPVGAEEGIEEDERKSDKSHVG
ncbi:ATP-binding protein [Paenibacillus sp. NPDC058071]|uniref:sensor histidine kinase n=1 Tax=Paenibacillus sp. NPDC058071 TaxID=3346326 RepID=UPI0036D7B03F